MERTHVVVGYESADRSRAAVAQGADLARRLGGDLVVVHVRDSVITPAPSSAVGLPMDPGGAVVTAPLTPERLDEVRAEVERDLAGLADGATVRIEQGWTPDVLRAVAEEVDAYALVVGGPGHGFGAFLEHLVTGSVTRELEKSCGVPVLVVPTD